jgi:hypothetical protein
MATSTRAVLKSTKNNARGKKMVEEPKPAVVPMISDMNARTDPEAPKGFRPQADLI